MRPISRRRFIRTGGAAVAFAKPAQSSTAIDHPAPGEDSRRGDVLMDGLDDRFTRAHDAFDEARRA
jgi:hypothetical protein